MMQEYKQQEQKSLEQILQEADEEEAFNREVNKEKARRAKKKQQQFDLKLFIKRFSQIGIVACLITGVASHIYEEVAYTNNGGAGVIESLDEIKGGDGIVGSEFSNDFTLNGKYYALPFPLQDLLDDGWTLANNQNTELTDTSNANGDYLTLVNNGSRITIEAESLTGKRVQVKDEYVTYLSVNESDVEDFEMSGHITFGMNDEDIQNIIKDYDEYNKSERVEDDYSYYSIYVRDINDPFVYSYTIDLNQKPGGEKRADYISLSAYENYSY